ncbi:MAG: hypothetical protein ACYTGZ_02985 [Planctomycetota bacterium]|jgi:hypothetical protein
MRRIATVILIVTALAAGEDLDGKITGGKAKKLVQKAVPMLKEAYELRKKLLFAEVQEGPAFETDLKKCVRLYDKGTLLLAEALDIKYDHAVNAMLVRAARELAKSQAGLTYLENRRRWREREAEKARQPKPEPKPRPEKKPDGKPEPKPEPKREPPPEKKRTLTPLREAPVTRPRFVEAKPPAVPIDKAPTRAEGLPEATADEWMRREKKGIQKRLKDYYGARRPGKLLYRCKLCAGKGKNHDGSMCNECQGSGQRINLHYFRKTFWNGFTPLFRDAEGALDALKAFLEHAKAAPASLGPVVKTFKVREIEPHGAWARVRVAIKTDERELEESMTLIRIGSGWYFFNPETDEDLLSAD